MFRQVTYKEVTDLMQKGNLVIADVRDKNSYDSGHINGAIHLSVVELNEFSQSTGLDKPILVYCYHGITSQSVAQHLVDQGFTSVYSLIGGFEIWKSHHTAPDEK